MYPLGELETLKFGLINFLHLVNLRSNIISYLITLID